MRQGDIKYITSVLKGERCVCESDWYEVLGFLCAHRVAGLFYKRAKDISLPLPYKAENILSGIYSAQVRKNILMRGYVGELAQRMIETKTPCIFAKGSLLSNMLGSDAVYADGERVSNDIDIVVKSDGITAVTEILREEGYVQGWYDRTSQKIIAYPRTEILSRRMNRGETAPFVKLTGNAETPFIEVDVNFSLGSVPGEKSELLAEMVDSRRIYEGKTELPAADAELFFLHLILHQYKESALYFTVARGKDLDLYKLADIYYMWKSRLLDRTKLQTISEKYGVNGEVGAVLEQVGKVFNDKTLRDTVYAGGKEQPEVIDYEKNRRYGWTVGITRRMCAFDGRKFLSPVKDDDR